MINGVLEGDVFYDRPGVAVVSWDQESRAVYIDWRSWADPAEFELLLEAGIRALAEHRGSRCLADCRNMKAVNPADKELIDRNWFPRAHAAGLRRMALVVRGWQGHDRIGSVLLTFRGPAEAGFAAWEITIATAPFQRRAPTWTWDQPSRRSGAAPARSAPTGNAGRS